MLSNTRLIVLVFNGKLMKYLKKANQEELFIIGKDY